MTFQGLNICGALLLSLVALRHGALSVVATNLVWVAVGLRAVTGGRIPLRRGDPTSTSAAPRPSAPAGLTVVSDGVGPVGTAGTGTMCQEVEAA